MLWIQIHTFIMILNCVPCAALLLITLTLLKSTVCSKITQNVITTPSGIHGNGAETPTSLADHHPGIRLENWSDHEEDEHDFDIEDEELDDDEYKIKSLLNISNLICENQESKQDCQNCFHEYFNKTIEMASQGIMTEKNRMILAGMLETCFYRASMPDEYYPCLGMMMSDMNLTMNVSYGGCGEAEKREITLPCNDQARTYATTLCLLLEGSNQKLNRCHQQVSSSITGKDKFNYYDTYRMMSCFRSECIEEKHHWIAAEYAKHCPFDYEAILTVLMF